jgi:vacuolar-type H+-ATPase subunit H
MKMIQSLTDAELQAQLRKAAESWDALLEEKRRRQREHFAEAEDAKSKQFVEHLEAASKIVSTWPEWKRNVLGTIERRGS